MEYRLALVIFIQANKEIAHKKVLHYLPIRLSAYWNCATQTRRTDPIRDDFHLNKYSSRVTLCSSFLYISVAYLTSTPNEAHSHFLVAKLRQLWAMRKLQASSSTIQDITCEMTAEAYG